jgi:hypothetical protein
MPPSASTTAAAATGALVPRGTRLTLHSVGLRVVVAPLRRPIVSNPIVGRFTEWPFILIDLRTHEGPVGRAYLEPYTVASARYIVPDQGLQWFEEPIQFDDLEGTAQLARELKTPIQIGPRSVRICCGSAKRPIGWSGATGRIPSWPRPSRCATARWSFPTAPATASHGTSRR